MFLARMVFFRLYESPRYLVHAGRPQDAVKSLQSISLFNGSDISIKLEDVRDHHYDAPVTVEGDEPRLQLNSTTSLAINVIADGSTTDSSIEASRSALIAHYSSTGETPDLDSRGNIEQDVLSDSPTEPMLKDVATTAGESLPHNNFHSGPESKPSRGSSVCEHKVCRVLPRWFRRPLWAWWDRVMMVLTPEWRRTTILVWIAWFAMSLGPSIFSWPSSISN